MKEVFQRPSATKNEEKQHTPVVEEKKTELVDFDAYNSTGVGHKFPKVLSSTKAKSTYDIVDELIRKMERNKIKAEENNQNAEWTKADKDAGIQSEDNATENTSDVGTKQKPDSLKINLADFTVASLRFPFIDLKNRILEESDGAIVDLINSPKSGLLAIINPEYILIESDDEDSLLAKMRQDVESRLSLEKLPAKTQAILESTDISTLNDEQLVVSIDVRKALINCVLMDRVFANSVFWDDAISLSRIIEIKDDTINFAVKSEVTGLDGCDEVMTLNHENIVVINICMSDERFRAQASEKLSAIDHSFRGIRYVKTVDVVKSMGIPEKALQYLIGISQDTPVNYIPLVEFADENYLENMKKVNNDLLAQMLSVAGSKSFDTSKIVNSFQSILDSDMIYLANVNNGVCIVPNLRKLGHLVVFGNTLPTTTFRSSVTTNTNTLAFVFSI